MINTYLSNKSANTGSHCAAYCLIKFVAHKCHIQYRDPPFLHFETSSLTCHSKIHSESVYATSKCTVTRAYISSILSMPAFATSWKYMWATIRVNSSLLRGKKHCSSVHLIDNAISFAGYNYNNNSAYAVRAFAVKMSAKSHSNMIL